MDSPEIFLERLPDRPELRALTSMLFALRDALVDASQALRELQCMVDIDGQQRAQDVVAIIFKKLTQF